MLSAEVLAITPFPPIPDPLDRYAAQFDDLFTRANQRAAFRQYLAGLLLPAERNKTLTALANAEPLVGAQHPAVQRLQWFLSESTWDAAAVTARRLEAAARRSRDGPPCRAACSSLMRPATAKMGTRPPTWGGNTWATGARSRTGWSRSAASGPTRASTTPLAVEPYTPERWFTLGKADPAFRTKPQIALELVDAALSQDWPFRAVVADCLYGEHHGFTHGLVQRAVPYVLALKPSHAWRAPAGAVGAVREVAAHGGWADADHPGAWVAVERSFRDGHAERWWALEGVAGPYGPDRPRRLVIATADPATLPEAATWYLETTLPLGEADPAEVVRLYGLRHWVEQAYKQVKTSLGWSQYQVRADRSMRRHWALVQCAFAFCWWAETRTPPSDRRADDAAAPADERGGKGGARAGSPVAATVAVLAAGPAAGAGLAGAGVVPVALLAGLVGPAASAPAPGPAGLAPRRASPQPV